MAELTARQQEILDLIRDYMADNGFPPTRAEIAQMLGFRSLNAAEDHLKALVRKGVIEILPGTSRGIVLLQEDHEEGLPVIGRVAAGNPILAEQHIEEYYALDGELFNPHADYLLRVKGMSMRDAGILDGDLLAVHTTREARSGQVIVARLNDEVTVKRLQRSGRHITLLPENPDFDPIEVDPKQHEFVIEGLGVGILRNGAKL